MTASSTHPHCSLSACVQTVSVSYLLNSPSKWERATHSLVTRPTPSPTPTRWEEPGYLPNSDQCYDLLWRSTLALDPH